VSSNLISKSHPGYKIKHTESGVVYPSINAAAKATGVSPSGINRAIRGKSDHVKGQHFENLGPMTSTGS
jgi:hypothetical protein